LQHVFASGSDASRRTFTLGMIWRLDPHRLQKLVRAFAALQLFRQYGVQRGIIPQRGEAFFVGFPIQIPFFCSRDGHDYVGSLSCLRFNQVWLGFGRDGMAQVGPIPGKLEKVRVHSPLGNTIDLARHLILWSRLYPRSETFSAW